MLDFIIAVLGLSLIFYVLFAGADFGAGIYEFLCLVNGRRSRKELVEKAIGPIWEANHIWLILAVVILFMGFPLAMTYISTYFHIPIAMILVGITFRGTAFAFRHYDPIKDGWQNVYSWLFGLSSVWTALWQGITVGAILSPQNQTTNHFLDVYVLNWLSPFNFLVGLFVVAVYLFLAQNFFMGESQGLPKEIHLNLKRDFWKSLSFVIISGVMVFFAGHHYDIAFVDFFYQSTFSIALICLTTLLLIPLIWSHHKGRTLYSKIVVGVQVTLIMLSLVKFKFPSIIDFINGNSLTFYNSAAPDATITQLFYALLVGISIVFPFLIYFFWVFKSSTNEKS